MAPSGSVAILPAQRTERFSARKPLRDLCGQDARAPKEASQHPPLRILKNLDDLSLFGFARPFFNHFSVRIELATPHRKIPLVVGSRAFFGLDAQLHSPRIFARPKERSWTRPPCSLPIEKRASMGLKLPGKRLQNHARHRRNSAVLHR